MKDKSLVGKVFVVVDVATASPVLVTNKVRILSEFVKDSGLSVSRKIRGVDYARSIRQQLIDNGVFSVFNHAFKEMGEPLEVYRTTVMDFVRKSGE